MSVRMIEKIECPRCGIKSKMEIWHALNAQLNPEAKEKLLKDELNLFHCGTCGFEGFAPVRLLYHDMGKKFFVQFFPFSEISDNKLLDQFTENAELDPLDGLVPEQDTPDYSRKIHYVFSMDELVRYVIFRDMLEERKASTRQQGRR